MPSLTDLRKKFSAGNPQQSYAQTGYLEVRGIFDEMITDTRSQLTPSQIVDRKLQAIANANQTAGEVPAAE